MLTTPHEETHEQNVAEGTEEDETEGEHLARGDAQNEDGC
jgi:hypothetical protein